MSGLFFAIIGGLIAMITEGIADFTDKINVQKFDALKIIFWTELIGTIPIILYSLTSKSLILKINSNLLPHLIILSIIDTIGCIFLYRALKKGKVSIITPVFATYSILSCLISTIIFKEPIKSTAFILIFLMLLGIILTSLDFSDIKNTSFKLKNLTAGIPECIISMIIYSFWYPLWNHYIDADTNWISTLLTYKLLLSLVAIIIIKLKNGSVSLKDSNNKLSLGYIGSLIVVGICLGSSDLGMSIGFQKSEYTSITTMISATSIFPTMLLARFFFNERMNLLQKIGIGIIGFSIVLMAYIYK